MSRSSRRRDALCRRLLAVADVTGALLALFATQALTDIGWQPAPLYFGVLAVVVASKAIGLYDRDELLIGKATLNEAPAVLHLATVYALVVAIVASAHAQPLPALSLTFLWISLFVATVTTRTLARWFVRAMTAPERCLVLGSQGQANQVREKLRLSDATHVAVVAFLPFEEFDLQRPRATGFATYVSERGIHRVIVAHHDSHDRVLQTVRHFKEYGFKVSAQPSILEVVGSSVEFDEINGTTLLGIKSFGLSRSSAGLKRAMDIIGSAFLLLLTAPMLLAIAIAIKLDSRGPVLFSQRRVGKDGRHFEMHKFRTMHDGADRLRPELADLNESEGLFKVSNDPRVTGVGRFLRSSSLDEMPQLINVLRGEMSLVGPRPLVEDEDEQVEGWHRRRLHLTPGMTGAWQIMGDARVPLREMVTMDYMYIVNWSLWSDVKILIRTVGHVVGRRGL